MEKQEYKIDKGVRKPPVSGGTDYKYPFRKMDVGDSFRFEVGVKEKVKSSMYKYCKTRPAVKFEIIGDRCWRTL